MQTAKIIPIPTHLMWWHLQTQHKRIVHKPAITEHQKRNNQQVQMLEAAIGEFQPNTGEVRDANQSHSINHRDFVFWQSHQQTQPKKRCAMNKQPLAPQPIGYLSKQCLLKRALKTAWLWATTNYSLRTAWHQSAR